MRCRSVPATWMCVSRFAVMMSLVIGWICWPDNETLMGIFGCSTPIVPVAESRPGPARAVRLAIFRMPRRRPGVH